MRQKSIKIDQDATSIIPQQPMIGPGMLELSQRNA
jgi:hypothetical protein